METVTVVAAMEPDPCRPSRSLHPLAGLVPVPAMALDQGAMVLVAVLVVVIFSLRSAMEVEMEMVETAMGAMVVEVMVLDLLLL